MTLPTLTREHVRAIQLEAQGLLTPPKPDPTPADVLAAIRRMNVLQIDTISVVARSPYLVLFARLGNYNPAWLDEQHAAGCLFEYWAHEACFIPIEDFRLFRREMLEERLLKRHFSATFYEDHRDELENILAHVRSNGEVRSADFEGKKHPGGWWNWKFEKIALEYFLVTGDILVSRRDKFQRVYNLRERVLPGWDDTNTASLEEFHRELALRSVRALGVARPGWLWDYYRLPKKLVPPMVAELVAEGKLLEVAVEGWKEACLVLPETIPALEHALAGEMQPTYTALLSPFDPLVWDRQRVRQLFDFDYTIEVYTPAAKRKFGYLNLPILHRGKLVGRLDPKAHRKEGIFAVNSCHLEAGVEPTPELAADLAAAIRRTADWHNTPEVRIEKVEPETFRAPLIDATLAEKSF